MRKVIVTPYNPAWQDQFEEAASELREVLRDECLIIQHIGSTAVEGLAAKPIIDLMPIVKDITKIDALNGPMQALGYRAKGENGLKGRRYFEKGGDDRTHHVHIYEDGNPEIDRHIAFREYLKTHPEEAAAYGKLKQQLASVYPEDIVSYIEGKTACVQRIEKKARS